MEEDAGKSIHAAGEPFTKVDLNRAGTPLLEIVTDPDLRSAEEVDAFMSGMRQLVRWLGISDGNMQEGSLRCDVNAWEAYDQLIADYQLSESDAAQLSEDREVYETFIAYAAESPAVKDLAKLWVNKLLPWLTEERLVPADLPISPEELARFQELILAGDVAASVATAKLLPELLLTPGDPQQRAEQLGLIQNTDTNFLSGLVDEVIAQNPDKVAAYRKGKKGLIGFFMGEVMKRSKGSAGPKETQALLKDRL